MAHADYDCCAVCDSKMSGYTSPDPTTKEMMCASCAVELFQQGVTARSGKELLKWIGSHDSTEVLRVLRQVGFRRCYYRNDVDDAVKLAGAEFDDDFRSIRG